MKRPSHPMVTAVLFVVTALFAGAGPTDAKEVPGGGICTIVVTDTPPPVLPITSKCRVPASAAAYRYNVVNILDGGELIFDDANGTIDFWAQAIIVEKGGKLIIGTPEVPIGTSNEKNVVTIHLYGSPQASGGTGVLCNSNPVETCGAPAEIWGSNVDANHNPKRPVACTSADSSNCVRKVQDLDIAADVKAAYPGTPDDYFYAYHEMFHDTGDHRAYFGYKVLAVSYGGSLQLFGKKGAIYKGDTACDPASPKSTGRSWVRLAKTAQKGDQEITVVTPACGLGWAQNDDIVITTTDYLPGHSEQRKISEPPIDNGNGTVTLKLDAKLDWHHNGEEYPIPNDAVTKLGLRINDNTNKVETRAAVGLLSRNIRIVSEGCKFGEPLPEPGKTCNPASGTGADAYFGGHTVFRQGYRTVQIQGVEFFQMGQGGRLGHYPVHFHHARKTHNPAHPELDSFVMDSSIWDSMTRWIVLHGTQDVTLARNVGYKSIGHGFYLEDGTEINNKLMANLGVFARAAVDNVQNLRKVPGILAAPDQFASDAEVFPFKSDYDHPSVFWIMNGWNDFQYNVAAGAGTCGACYWFVSGANSTISRDLKWESYASLQSTADRAGTTPLKTFIGNACTAAMTSFQTVTKTEPCQGVRPTPSNAGQPGIFPTLPPVKNDLARNTGDLGYYPIVHESGGRFATRCGGVNHDPHADCSTKELQPICASGANEKDCMITALEGYTTSFNWAAFNFAAIWLRPQWYLLTDSVITDVQQAGLTMVTGGGYSASDVIQGHWALTRKSVFIGHTQKEKPTEVPDSNPKRTIPMPDNPYASNGGPFNPVSKLRCAQDVDKNRPGNYCLSEDDGISFQIGNAFAVYQRLFSVYDGPAYQDSNAYLDITSRTIDDCKPLSRSDQHSSICDPPVKTISRSSAWWAGTGPLGLPRAVPDRKDETKDFCYMPNAAIGWKQPNGFYYPPAFHSTGLYFNNVETRHFVVTPLFKEGTLDTDISRTAFEYCSWNAGLFNGFTSIDRQTVLNDDDGTLTGYQKTIVVNLDDFFSAPVEAIQCASDTTSKTSPYAYVTTVVYPECAVTGTCAITTTDPNTHARLPNPHTGDWDQACSNENCYGIPLHRLDLTKSDKGVPKAIRMMGQSTGQRSTLTVNHGTYYVDTRVPKKDQMVFVKQKDPLVSETCADVTPPSQECNVSVFKENETYYLFLIYAKADTEQTYRFYVGPGLTDFPDIDLKMQLVQADIGPSPIVFKNKVAMKKDRVKWIDKANGIVEVTLVAADLADFAGKFAEAKKDDCQPTTFCSWDGAACRQCTEFDTDPQSPTFGQCKTRGSDEICKWAVVDPHCPAGGCVGIQFTMPAGFQAGTGPGPDQIAKMGVDLKCANTNFNVPFTKVSDGACPADGDRLELNFSDVEPPNCQDEGASESFPKCACPK
jgi:hypothetical protein